jgi:hypothetical protein
VAGDGGSGAAGTGGADSETGNGTVRQIGPPMPLIEFTRRVSGLPDGRVRVRIEVRARGRRVGVIRHESERPGWEFVADREAAAGVRAVSGGEWRTAAEAREVVERAVRQAAGQAGNPA